MYEYHVFYIIKTLSLFILSFGVAIAAAPFLIAALYHYKAWKKKPREDTLGGDKTPIFTSLHSQKETTVPRMGGILIWGTTLLVTYGIWLVSVFWPDSVIGRMNFVSRSQTWLPLFTLFAASLLGLVDDILVVQSRGKYVGGGMVFRLRLAFISAIGVLGGWWFFFKLGWSTVYIPFYGNLEIGLLYLPLFLLVTLATFSSGVLDGLDGLSAGVLAPIFMAYGVIAYVNQLYDIASLITVIIGALITFLWFNVHPAKFYMSETGIMGLLVTLAVIAFLTNAVFFLPIIGIVLVVESASVILQLFSKRVLKRKIFLSAPIHHHFQALGWPESQVTMRFWIISSVASAFGLVIFFLARFI